MSAIPSAPSQRCCVAIDPDRPPVHEPTEHAQKPRYHVANPGTPCYRAPWAFEDLNDKPILQVARGLGLRVSGATFGPCPVCRTRFIPRTGRQALPCRAQPDGRNWECTAASCIAVTPASAADLVLWSATGARRQPRGKEEWERVWALVKPWGLEPTSRVPSPPPVGRAYAPPTDRRRVRLLEHRLEGTRFRSLRGSGAGERVIGGLGALVDLNQQGRIWRFLPGDEPDSDAQVGLQCWSPATFDGGRGPEHVRSVSALVIELRNDTDNTMRDAARKQAAELGWAHLTYSSYRHEPDRPCWTLVLPLDRPVKPAAYKPLWDAVTHRLGLRGASCLDHTGRSAAKLYLIAATHSSRMQHSDVLITEGKAIRAHELNIDLELDREATREIPKRSGESIAAACSRTMTTLALRERGLQTCLPIPWRGVANAMFQEAVIDLELEAAEAGKSMALPNYTVMNPGAHLLVGASGVGKTQYALSIALEAALEGHEVLYVSLQSEIQEILCRLMYLLYAREHDVNRLPAPECHWSTVQYPHGQRGRTAAKRVRERSLPTLEQLPNLRILDTMARQSAKPFGPTEIGGLAAELFEGTSGGRPALLVIDYLQALAPSTDSSGRPVSTDLDLRMRLERTLRVLNPYLATSKLSVLLVSACAEGIDKHLASIDPSDLPAVEALQGAGEGARGLEFSCTSVQLLCRAQHTDDKRAPASLDWSQTRLLCLPKSSTTDPWVILGWDGGAFYDCFDSESTAH